MTAPNVGDNDLRFLRLLHQQATPDHDSVTITSPSKADLQAFHRAKAAGLIDGRYAVTTKEIIATLTFAGQEYVASKSLVGELKGLVRKAYDQAFSHLIAVAVGAILLKLADWRGVFGKLLSQ